MDHPDWNALLEQERREGGALHQSGMIRGLWRVPGRYEAVTIFDVESVEVLDKLLWSLPLWKFMDIQVEALAEHYYNNPDASRFEDIASPDPLTGAPSSGEAPAVP